MENLSELANTLLQVGLALLAVGAAIASIVAQDRSSRTSGPAPRR